MKQQEKDKIEGYAQSILASKVMGDGVKSVATFALEVLKQKPVGFADPYSLFLAKNWFRVQTVNKQQQPGESDLCLYFSPQVNTDWKLRYLEIQADLLALRKVREGWALVPVEPTDDMIAAGTAVDGGVYSIWKDMLTAAPEPE